MSTKLWRSQKCILGGAGYRSRYLSHAKRALYHLSYAPVLILETQNVTFKIQGQKYFLNFHFRLSIWFLAHKNNDKLFRVFLVFLFHVSIHRNIGMYLFLQENIYVTKWRKKSLFSAVLSIILLYTFWFFLACIIFWFLIIKILLFVQSRIGFLILFYGI